MDLNPDAVRMIKTEVRWLPRGAMDLNPLPPSPLPNSLSWLPRGAMDLNDYNRLYDLYHKVGSLVEPWI